MKTFILVAGIDYEFKGVNFRVFCNNRVKRLTAANKGMDDLRFQIFDFRRGEVTTHEITFRGGRKVEKVSSLSPSPFQPVTKAHYEKSGSGTDTHYRFRDGQRDKMSVLEVYKAVQQVGRSTPKSLVELSFFSHAWMGGPILVNSFDDGAISIPVPRGRPPMTFRLPSGARDPDDMDPRAAKDFAAPTMDRAALSNFQGAFRDDGYVWIWGCAFPRLVHQILHKIERHPSYKSSGVGDDEVFTITNFTSAEASLLEKFLQPELGRPFPDKRKIEIEFRFLKHFFCKVTAASYTHHVSAAAQVKAFGGVMGTYSEYDTGKLPLMSVHKGFARHFAFYKNYLGFAFDPENRRYGVYEPGFACVTPTP